ncbi:hypothetical protein [Streptomyces sp. NPDC056549]|uniref:hypothetical protein n=1 Tax=Streptomyces sp. NPDC056549 TaxID=3345864 RepID=UPI0036CF35B7
MTRAAAAGGGSDAVLAQAGLLDLRRVMDALGAGARGGALRWRRCTAWWWPSCGWGCCR